jgi:CDP-alcohol phosphatidyltransferase
MSVDLTRPEVDRPTYAGTLRRLRSAQKSNRNVQAYSRWVNRPLARYLAAAAFHLGLTPNQVTLVSGGFTLGAILTLAVAPATVATGLAVSAALVLGYLLDSADGQLARLRGGGSAVGEWMDHMIDCVKTSSLHLAVLLAMYRSFELPGAGWLLVPLGWSLTAGVVFFGFMLTDQLRRNGLDPSAPAPLPADASGTTLRSLLVLPTDYGLLCLVFALLGWHDGFRAVYTGLLVLYAGFALAAVVKWYLELAAVDAGRAATAQAGPQVTT